MIEFHFNIFFSDIFIYLNWNDTNSAIDEKFIVLNRYN